MSSFFCESERMGERVLCGAANQNEHFYTLEQWDIFNIPKPNIFKHLIASIMQ